MTTPVSALAPSPDPSDAPQSAQFELGEAIGYIFRHHGMAMDRLRLAEGLSRVGSQPNTLADVAQVLDALGLEQPEILSQPDPVYFPLLAYQAERGWGVISEAQPDGRLVFKQSHSTAFLLEHSLTLLLHIPMSQRQLEQKNQTFGQLLTINLGSYRSIVIEAAIATVIVNLLALAASLFSMQVYDRVIPTSSVATLVILASGVSLVVLLELALKLARSKVMDQFIMGLDQHLSREVFQRLLNVRMDQLPGSVGSMAAQLRGYEQVRSFYTASSLFTAVDLPMGIVLLIIMSMLGSPWVAVVPLVAGVISIILGLTTQRRMDALAAEGAQANYRKTGILVEAVEGMETIKAGGGRFKFLSRWLDVMKTTIHNDIDMRHLQENLNYLVQMLQQLSYIAIIIVGALVVMDGGMTMGALIACSILGGRVLTPIMQIPNLLIQRSHAKAAQKNVEALFDLEQDNHNVAQPLAPTKLYGRYDVENMAYMYHGNNQPAINIQSLHIQPGERVAILGAIGSGKSTLLKILAGLYAAKQGRVLLDGLDINQISHDTLNQKIGYLQQDHRLFQGTLRENLLIGMASPSDDVMQRMLQRTGLIRLVNSHSSGLDLPITEGGRGLSGGQKQLVAFSRFILTKPDVFLLDEPTSSMDNALEQQCLRVLAEELQQGQTLIMSTHKPSVLPLVNRIIVMDRGQIVIDGPRQAVLEHLRQNEVRAQQPKTQPQASAQVAVQQQPQPQPPVQPPANGGTA